MLLLKLLSLLNLGLLCQAESLRYKIPNPFKHDNGGYYYSVNSSYEVSKNHKKVKFDYHEVVQLGFGYSFLLERKHDDPEEAFLKIGDGRTDKCFIMLDPDSLDGHKECELDHQHNHRHLFPWRYEFDTQSKNGGHKHKFVLGVIAIWLNAIDQDLKSDQVDKNSPYPSHNLWVMKDENLEVKLLFEKPKTKPGNNYTMQDLIDPTRLARILITRHHVESHQAGDIYVNDEQVEIIEVFGRPSPVTGSNEILKFFHHLKLCRENTKDHQVMPDLMQQMSHSRGRMFRLEFIKENSKKNEHRIEWFSFKEEAQMIERFETRDLIKFSDSLRHYKISEDAERPTHCSVDDELPELGDLIPPKLINIYRSDETEKAYISGLSALLMNLASYHYKMFSLTTNKIQILNFKGQPEPKKVKVHEWVLEDKNKTIHLYFRLQVKPDIKDLVKVEICPPKSASYSERDKGPIETYFILNMETEVDDQLVRYAFELPDICKALEVRKKRPDREIVAEEDNSGEELFPTTQDDEDDQRSAQGQEFDPEYVTEVDRFPSLFEILQGIPPEYTIVSKIKSGEKEIYLEENINLDRQFSKFTIYRMKGAMKEPEINYYINYKSELVFKEILGNNSCHLSRKMDPWLRLFSDKYDYSTNIYLDLSRKESKLDDDGVKLRLYGIGAIWQHASQSNYLKYAGKISRISGLNDENLSAVSWILSPEGDERLTFRFEFWFDPTRFNQYPMRSIALKSIHVLNNVEGSKFNKLEVNIESIRVFPVSPSNTLPRLCLRALEMLSKEEIEVDKSHLPKFYDFLNAYSARYSIVHPLITLSDDGQVANSIRVEEHFDPKSKRGILNIDDGINLYDIFIEIDKGGGSMYLFVRSTKKCQRITNVNTPLSPVYSFSEFDPDQLYGLASMLEQMSKCEIKLVKLRLKYDSSADYSIVFIHSIEIGQRLSAEVVSIEQANGAQIEVTEGDGRQAVLERIDLKKEGSDEIVTSIVVDSISQNVLPEQSLPRECSLDKEIRLTLPKFSDLMESGEPLHLKSQVLDPVSKQFVYIDEWYNEKMIRIKTTGGSVIETLTDLVSGESFDLSTPYRCRPMHDQWNDFWTKHTLVDELSKLHYSVLSLWWMAVQEAVDLHVIVHLGSEAMSQIWRVSSPSSADFHWTYWLIFGKSGNGATQVPRSIQVMTPSNSARKPIEIDVINYKSAADRDTLKNFLLPEGYGCKRRHELWKDVDEFDLRGKKLIQYEASLELHDIEDKSSEAVILPVITGKFVESNWPQSSNTAEEHRIRYHDGSAASNRIVYDSTLKVCYNIDLLRGSCDIQSVSEKGLWTLRFPAEDHHLNIVMSDDIIQKFFLQTYKEGFSPINVHQLSSTIKERVYENEYENMQLSKSLVGPARIVRYYQQSSQEKLPERSMANIISRMHRSMSVKVLILNQDMDKVRAMLNMNLRIGHESALDVIDNFDVSQCYNHGNPLNNEGAATFKLDYNLDKMTLTKAEESKIELDFLLSLVNLSRISQVQLGGRPKIELNAGTMSIIFKVLGNPTAIKYFSKEPRNRMNKYLEGISHFFTVSGINECSMRCDKFSCAMMSYCQDGSCQLISAEMLLVMWTQRVVDQLDPLSSLLVPDDKCTFYHFMERSITNLTLLRFLLDETVNNPDKGHLKLIIDKKSIKPASFSELPQNQLYNPSFVYRPTIESRQKEDNGSTAEQGSISHYIPIALCCIVGAVLLGLVSSICSYLVRGSR